MAPKESCDKVNLDILCDVTHPIKVIDNPHLVIRIVDLILNNVGVWVTDHIFCGGLVAVVRELNKINIKIANYTSSTI